MNRFLSAVAGTFAVGLMLLALPVVAQTPDGETPAEETICSPLKDDGITKGLYGLCVAFCEAQDIADYDIPMTDEDIEALMDDAPSGRILANYNRKKTNANNPADPEMPCIQVAPGPCPCWSSDELAVLDGLDNNTGDTLDNFECPVDDFGTSLRENSETTEDLKLSRALAFQNDEVGRKICILEIGDVRIRRLDNFAQPPTLTSEDFATCKDDLIAACVAAGF